MKKITATLAFLALFGINSSYADPSRKDINANTKLSSKELSAGIAEDTLLYLYEGYNQSLFVFGTDAEKRKFQKKQSMCNEPNKPSYISELLVVGAVPSVSGFADPYPVFKFAEAPDYIADLAKQGAHVYQYTSSDGGKSGITATYVYPKPFGYTSSVELYDGQYPGKNEESLKCNYAKSSTALISSARKALATNSPWVWTDPTTNATYTFNVEKTVLSGREVPALVLQKSASDSSIVFSNFQANLSNTLQANPWLSVELKLRLAGQKPEDELEENFFNWREGSANPYDVAVYSKKEEGQTKVVFVPQWSN